MTAPAPKIKAFMATIKETYCDNNDGNLFSGLLQMELVLRGVLPITEKMWQQIQSSIGKPLVTNFPMPLLAGANVLAGRLAEAALSDETRSKETIDPSIVKRAEDINDIRWILLFQQEHFGDIARGYFCAAAAIQKDTPPMWKKLWDAWGNEELPISSTPFEAQVAIENLIRIASDKGNIKRVAELKLRLVASYLNKIRIPIATVKIGKQPNIPIAQAFGDDVTSQLSNDMTPKKAKQLIQSININDLSDVDKHWFPLLLVQVGIAEEEASIEHMAQDQHKINQNRSLTSSLEMCRSKFRASISVEVIDPLHDASITLRDSIVRWWNQEKDEVYWTPSLETLSNCIQRLRDRALAKMQESLSNDQGWRQLLDYIAPLFEAFKDYSNWIFDLDQSQRIGCLQKWLSEWSSAEKNTVSLLVLTFSEIYWMLLANGIENTMDSTLHFSIDLLSVLIQQAKSIQTQAPAAVGSSNNIIPQSQQWKAARSILLCVTGSPRLVAQISREGIATKQQSDAALAYLRCIVAWSGWYQRSWSYSSNLSDVRQLLAAAQLNDGNRPLGTVESILLDLATADAELFNGGFPTKANDSYLKVLDVLKRLTDKMDPVMRIILESHCYNGLARVCRIDGKIDQQRVHELAQRTLHLMADLEIPGNIKPFYIWHDSTTFLKSASYQISVARQLIADSLISRGSILEAQSFLEVAVQDSPLDAEAGLALGAFLLRVALYLKDEPSTTEVKAAQIQLLKAAKLDASQADPFSLLGIWFEESGDANRAIGCFTKSLALNPCNPIAGRGLLRLKSKESIKDELDAAIDMNSPVSGWAWRAVGLQSEDEFAVVALLKALRCRDVSAPSNESLGIFYHQPGVDYVNEYAETLAELASCYRRLGRYTASIRAFHASIESAGENVASSILCACAQVELELSLFDDAVEKFERVLFRKEGFNHAVASYGQGVGLYYLARRDFEDRKYGSSMARIQRAIECCEISSSSFGCIKKLLGDLYSFGALLPQDLFLYGSGDNMVTAIKNQVELVGRGASAYRSLIEFLPDDVPNSVKASALCDVGSNILLQAQISENAATQIEDTGVGDLYEKSRREFVAALELDPLCAPAWCGLGCAVIADDPLLAQHAFSRCLEIEQMFPDAYANMGFLYTSRQAFHASEGVMNALTQVADTPMMWINRAFMLERNAKSMHENESTAVLNLEKAADAYRAAMQVMTQPESQLGLAVTCRVDSNVGAGFAHQQLRKDMLSYIREYNERFVESESGGTVSFLEGVMRLEQVAVVCKSTSWTNDAMEIGESLILKETCALNLEAVKKTSFEDGDGDRKQYSEASTFPFNVSLQRQIVHEPYRPELWLQHAKELLSCSAAFAAVDSAGVAAMRAAAMMTDQLVHPPRCHELVDPSTFARNLSDALTLVFWLRPHVLSNDKGELEESTNYIKTTDERASFALDRALMIDPTNTIAREALQMLS